MGKIIVHVFDDPEDELALKRKYLIENICLKYLPPTTTREEAKLKWPP